MSTRTRGRRSRAGGISLEAARPEATSRSTRSSERREPTRPAFARRGRSSATSCPKPIGSTGMRGSRSMRRGSRTRWPPSGSARPGMPRCPTRSAHGAFARRFVSAHGRTCSLRSTRCRRPSRRIPRGDTGRRARSSASGRTADAAAALRRARRRDQLLRHAVGGGDRTSGRSSRARRSSPTPMRWPRSARRAGVRRAVKLAQLDMRPESQREWLYVVRGLPDDALLLAAEYARREGLYDRAINTAERTSARHDFGLRYLMPFRDAVRGRRAGATRSTWRSCSASLARSRASPRTSCPRRARSDSCS